eukprot:2015055-Rhodomonas_salina.1
MKVLMDARSDGRINCPPYAISVPAVRYPSTRRTLSQYPPCAIPVPATRYLSTRHRRPRSSSPAPYAISGPDLDWAPYAITVPDLDWASCAISVPNFD